MQIQGQANQGTVDSPEHRRDVEKAVEKREADLDHALEDTFPASDPVSTTPQPPIDS